MPDISPDKPGAPLYTEIQTQVKNKIGQTSHRLSITYIF